MKEQSKPQGERKAKPSTNKARAEAKPSPGEARSGGSGAEYEPRRREPRAETKGQRRARTCKRTARKGAGREEAQRGKGEDSGRRTTRGAHQRRREETPRTSFALPGPAERAQPKPEFLPSFSFETVTDSGQEKRESEGSGEKKRDPMNLPPCTERREKLICTRERTLQSFLFSPLPTEGATRFAGVSVAERSSRGIFGEDKQGASGNLSSSRQEGEQHRPSLSGQDNRHNRADSAI